MDTETISTTCDRCEKHLTDWGMFNDLIEQILGKKLTELDMFARLELLKVFYEQMKLDERTQFISNQKRQTTEQIQTYKKANIKAINK